MEQVLWEFRDQMVEVECTVLERICGGGEMDFPSSPVVENLPVNAGEGQVWDTGSIPGLGRFHMLQGN